MKKKFSYLDIKSTRNIVADLTFCLTLIWTTNRPSFLNISILLPNSPLLRIISFLILIAIISNSLKRLKNVKTQHIWDKKLALFLLINCENFCHKWHRWALFLTAQTHTLGFPENSVVSVLLLLSLCLSSAFYRQRHIMFAYSCHIQVTYKCDCWLQQERKYISIILLPNVVSVPLQHVTITIPSNTMSQYAPQKLTIVKLLIKSER